MIFICQFDLFDAGRHIYTFENICKEDKNIFLGDEAVETAKKNREWRHEYMTLLMRDQENIERGIKKGIKGAVSVLRKHNIADAEIIQEIQEEYNLTREEAEEYL